MTKLKRLAQRYAALWREMPCAMTVLYVTIVGGMACAALMARDARDGPIVVLVFLAVLLATACAQVDLRK